MQNGFRRNEKLSQYSISIHQMYCSFFTLVICNVPIFSKLIAAFCAFLLIKNVMGKNVVGRLLVQMPYRAE